MKAVRFAEYGGPEVLQLVDVDEPHAGAGQIRIAVRAAGVNMLDGRIRAGQMRQRMPITLPAGTGKDAAGVVDEVGEGVTDVALGDAVFGSGLETYAEYAVLTSWAKKPAELSFEEAAGYPVPAETSIRILKQVGVQPGQTLLVSGASGGVGSGVLQIARERGIKVIGTASERNHGYIRGLGAIPTTYGPGLVERVRGLAPGGIDAALDLAGSGIIDELIELTGAPANVVTIADTSVQTPEGRIQLSTGPENASVAFSEVAQLFTEGKFRIPVEKTFPLASAAEAQRESDAGHVTGRLIVTVP